MQLSRVVFAEIYPYPVPVLLAVPPAGFHDGEKAVRILGCIQGLAEHQVHTVFFPAFKGLQA